VSSANVPMWAVGVIGMSAVCNKNSRDATLRNSRVYVVDGRICLTVFNLTYTMMHGSTKLKFSWRTCVNDKMNI
jgi:hypothetical protein